MQSLNHLFKTGFNKTPTQKCAVKNCVSYFSSIHVAVTNSILCMMLCMYLATAQSLNLSDKKLPCQQNTIGGFKQMSPLWLEIGPRSPKQLWKGAAQRKLFTIDSFKELTHTASEKKSTIKVLAAQSTAIRCTWFFFLPHIKTRLKLTHFGQTFFFQPKM